ncbi:MAG: GNAT family N-acetyltransferase [Anaerolineales bacterium]
MVERTAVLIRPATEADLPALEWGGEYRHFRRVYRAAMTDALQDRRLVLAAEVGGEVVGQLFVQLENVQLDPGGRRPTGYLYALRVRPPFRNQGIGTALVTYAEDDLRQRRFVRAAIAVAKDNSGALRLYRRLGYRVFAEDPGNWSYLDDEGQLRHVLEPSYLLDKDLASLAETLPPS